MIDCKLNILLAENRINQKELSEATGIGQNSISRYTNNTWVKFDKEHLDKLCKYFKCNIEDIITFKKDIDFVNDALDEATEYLQRTKFDSKSERDKYLVDMLQDLNDILKDINVREGNMRYNPPKTK